MREIELDIIDKDPCGKCITVHGNGMLPLYRHGDRLIASEAAPIRVGDRIVVETHAREVHGGTFVHKDRQSLVVSRGGISHKDMIIRVSDIAYLGRVLWASQ